VDEFEKMHIHIVLHLVLGFSHNQAVRQWFNRMSHLALGFDLVFVARCLIM
jgi:hypothetical protein